MIVFWIILLISFSYYSASILIDYGYFAFFPPIHAEASLQVFLDLCLSGIVALYLMYDRRKKHNQAITPVLITCVGFIFIGSQALLIYMICDWLTQKGKPSQRGLSAR